MNYRESNSRKNVHITRNFVNKGLTAVTRKILEMRPHLYEDI